MIKLEPYQFVEQLFHKLMALLTIDQQLSDQILVHYLMLKIFVEDVIVLNVIYLIDKLDFLPREKRKKYLFIF